MRARVFVEGMDCLFFPSHLYVIGKQDSKVLDSWCFVVVMNSLYGIVLAYVISVLRERVWTVSVGTSSQVQTLGCSIEPIHRIF